MPKLRTSAKLIYLLLCRLCKEGKQKEITATSIAELMGLHRNTVNPALKSLEDSGLIKITRKHSAAGTFDGFSYEVISRDVDVLCEKPKNKQEGLT